MECTIANDFPMRIMAPSIPEVGSEIVVEGIGLCHVEEMWHNSKDDFIRLVWKDVLPQHEGYTGTYRFSVGG